MTKKQNKAKVSKTSSSSSKIAPKHRKGGTISKRKTSKKLSKSAANQSPTRTSPKKMAATDSKWSNLKYMNGFGNHFESEAEKGALPIGRNNPQKCPMGLVAQQLSGTPFTFCKNKNQRSWLYRILTTIPHGPWTDKTSSASYAKWVSNFGDSKGLRVTPE